MVLRDPASKGRLRARPAARGMAPRTLLAVSLSVVLVGGMIVLAGSNRAQNRPASQSNTSASPSGSAGNGNRGARKSYLRTETTTGKADTGADGRRSLDYYTRGVRDNLFSAPPPPPPPKPAPPKPVPVPKPPALPHVPVAPINPFASWSYTGTVKMGDQMMALLENSQTRDGEYVKVGDNFQGAQVLSITDQMVTLTLGGKPSQLAKADSIVVTPLNAPPNPGGPQPGQPGGPQPGAPPPPGPVPNMAPGTPNIVLPNGRVLQGGRAVRYQQMLNRQFEATPKAQ